MPTNALAELVYFILLGLFIVGLLARHRQTRRPPLLRYAILWAMLFVTVTLIFLFWDQIRPTDQPQPEPPPTDTYLPAA